MGYTFEGYALPKASEQPGEIPLQTVRVATVVWQECLKFASRHRAAILSDNIINENLKIIANKLFGSKSLFCLIFLLDHCVLVTEFIARLCNLRTINVQTITLTSATSAAYASH